MPQPDPGESRARLLAVLADAQRLGFLGPGSVKAHIDHADAFRRALPALTGADRVADLGSGGGIPALWHALTCEAQFALIESSPRRAAFLRAAATELDLERRVEVVESRAEVYAHSEAREQFSVVTARSFAAPAVTAEIGSGLVSVGGRVVVSSSPGGLAAWDEGVLGQLGLGGLELVIWDGLHFVSLSKTSPCAAQYPRRTGLPAKRPLW